jgi:hypothetical protein
MCHLPEGLVGWSNKNKKNGSRFLVAAALIAGATSILEPKRAAPAALFLFQRLD